MNDHRSSSFVIRFSLLEQKTVDGLDPEFFEQSVRAPACRLRLIDGDGMDGVGHEGVARVRACVRPAACALGPAPCQGVQGWARGWTVDAGGRALQKIKNTKVRVRR